MVREGWLGPTAVESSSRAVDSLSLGDEKIWGNIGFILGLQFEELLMAGKNMILHNCFKPPQITEEGARLSGPTFGPLGGGLGYSVTSFFRL